MTCRECGADLPEGALFCGECGAAVELVEAGIGAASGARPAPRGDPAYAAPSRRVPTAWERFAPRSGGDVPDGDVPDGAVVDAVEEDAERVEVAVTDETDEADEIEGADEIEEADALEESDAFDEADGPDEAELPEGVEESDGSVDLFEGLDDESSSDEAVPDAEPDREAEADAEDQIADDSALCPQCDADVDPADVFCGECGFLLRAVMPGPGDTAVIPPLRAQVPPPLVPGGAAPPPAWPVDVRDQPLEPPVALEPVPASEADDQPDEPDDDPDQLDEPDPHPNTDLDDDSSDPTPEDQPVESLSFDDAPVEPTGGRARPAPDPFPWGADASVEDLEATRVVSQHGTGERFVLQFSTGESVTVHGAGLIGRNPSAQPGEYVDQLVSIFDVGKSVSKTHLEFGQEGGRFWVSDRYSTNGSIVRQPEAEPRRCEPGRRYFVMRGTRIDVGEQFFVVS